MGSPPFSPELLDFTDSSVNFNISFSCHNADDVYKCQATRKQYPIKVTRCAVAPVIYVFIRPENTIYRYRNTAEGCAST